MLVDQVATQLEDDLDLHEVCIAGEGEVCDNIRWSVLLHCR